jgi:hypothetical protein
VEVLHMEEVLELKIFVVVVVVVDVSAISDDIKV